MEDNFEQLKTLKELLESGAISKTEYDTMKSELLRESMASDGVKSAMAPSAFNKLLKKYKWFLIALPVILIGGFLIWNSMKEDPKVEAEKLAQEFCDCQIQNNKEYVSQLNSFIQSFQTKGFEYSSDAEQLLDQMSNEYNANTLNVSISRCFNNLKLRTEEIRSKYKEETSEGKEFWFAYQTKISKNIEMVAQTEQIATLQNAAYQKISSLVYSDPEDLENRKNSISSIMSNFYSSMSYNNLDAYDYFAYNVEKYYGKKNITPTDINILLNTENDYSDTKFKFVQETLQLVSADDKSEIWEFSTEFQTFRTSKEKYQICNIWYEVKFNKSDKILSYIEKKVENTKYLSPEQYNEITNNGNSNENEADW